MNNMKAICMLGILGKNKNIRSQYLTFMDLYCLIPLKKLKITRLIYHYDLFRSIVVIE